MEPSVRRARYIPAVRGLDGVLEGAYRWYAKQASIGPHSRRARRFGAFGSGSGILFPTVALYGEEYIRIGRDVIVAPYCSLSAGVMPGHVPDNDPVVTIGDGVLIGRGSGVVGHRSVSIGDGVFTGHNVYVTDANHGYEDVEETIGRQFAPPRPVVVGAGSWLGHGSIVLPGATVGEHVAVGAGSVVTGDLPGYSVAVGNPARVIRRYDTERAEWIRVLRDQRAGEG
jgi:acetyltransferase-like isoleucine patch superfamily enzyme